MGRGVQAAPEKRATRRSKVRFAPTSFLLLTDCICRKKAAVASLPYSSFSAKGPACCGCALVNARATPAPRFPAFCGCRALRRGERTARWPCTAIFRLTSRCRLATIIECECACSSVDRVPGYEPVGRRFESCQARHVGAKSALLRRLFCFWQIASAAKKPPSPCSLAPPFPQKAPLAAAARL